MPWSYAVPAEAGWYWWQYSRNYKAEPVRLMVGPNGHMEWGDSDEDSYYRVAGERCGRWCRMDGPPADEAWPDA